MMQARRCSNLTGYVLAGGRSRRMGRDKAFLQLGNKPLVQLAAEKLRCVASEVNVLGNRSELASYGALVADLHADSGPLGGIEAAIRHTPTDWILILPVDMPFLPAALLESWVHCVMESATARISFFVVEGKAQPALSMLHRELAPFIADAVEEGRLGLYMALSDAGRMLAECYRLPVEDVLLPFAWGKDVEEMPFAALKASLTAEQRATRHLWFANLNTPEEFAAAEAFADVLDSVC